jgi:hypothetical protein
MYPNKQLGWAFPVGKQAAPPTNHTHNSTVLRTPAYIHLALAVVVFVSVLLVGTTQVIKTMASKQVVYQPSKVTPHIDNAEAAPAIAPKTAAPAPQPTPQPAVAPAPINQSQQVQAVLDSWKTAHAAQQWGVAVQGLGEDKTSASINADTSFNTASVYYYAT